MRYYVDFVSDPYGRLLLSLSSRSDRTVHLAVSECTGGIHIRRYGMSTFPLESCSVMTDRASLYSDYGVKDVVDPV